MLRRVGGKEAQEIGTGTLWWLSKEQMGEGGSPEPNRLDEQSRIQVVALKEGGVLTQGTDRASSPVAPFSILGEQMREWRP